MIIETSCNRFFQVTETNDANLAHVWFGFEVKKLRGQWVPTARSARAKRPELVRKAGSLVVDAEG